jgi:hypothetical protein
MRYLNTTEDILNKIVFDKITPVYPFLPKIFSGVSLLQLSCGPSGVLK